VPRQDFVQALQLLDMGVYNNNFVSEQNSPGARGKGVQVWERGRGRETVSCSLGQPQTYRKLWLALPLRLASPRAVLAHDSSSSPLNVASLCVQVDRETPLRHLAEAKAALDEILAFSAAGGVP